MINLVSDVFDVPLAESTILQIREVNAYARMMQFRNLTAGAIAVTVQQSSDGGASWADVVSFNLGAVGSGTELSMRSIGATNQLRVRASGGGDDRDLLIALFRAALDASHIWSSAVL